MDKILLGHGSGGRLTANLIKDIFYKHLGNEYLAQETDGTNLGTIGGEVVVTTDGFVVKPLFFPGGDIGKLAVCGSVNDLAVMGAIPKYLAVSFVIEEGLAIKDLEKIVSSLATEAEKASVKVVAGDTKVVEKGLADGLYISVTGVGIKKRSGVFPGAVREGDLILINGPLGDHAAALIKARGDFEFDFEITSDCRNLSGLIDELFKRSPGLKFLRDITRGGLAAVLNEISSHYEVGMEIEAEKVPVRPQVASVCNLLGFDPMHLANEGKIVAIVSPDGLGALPVGMIVIGRVVAGDKPYLKNSLGGRRIIDIPDGEILPRIC